MESGGDVCSLCSHQNVEEFLQDSLAHVRQREITKGSGVLR